MTELCERIEEAVRDFADWLAAGISTAVFVAVVAGVVLPMICIFNPEHQRKKRAQHRADL